MSTLNSLNLNRLSRLVQQHLVASLQEWRIAVIVLGLALALAIVGVSAAQEISEGTAILFACDSTGRDIAGETGATQTIYCPAGCTGSVWGTDIYTDDSSVCTAARHAGVIADAGGYVAVTILEGQESYAGSERNGVASSDWGSWERSFSVAPAGAGE